MKRNPRDRRCTYLITLDEHIATFDEVQELAQYLSFLSGSIPCAPRPILPRAKR